MSDPETLPLRLTPRQRDLILREALIPEEIEERLRLGEMEDDMLVFELGREELDELADYLAAAANHTKNRDLEAELEDVIQRIDGLMSMAGWGDPLPPDLSDADIPPEIRDAILEIIQDPEVTSLEQVEERIRQLAEEHLEKARPLLGGYTPMQVVRLLEAPWEGEGAVVRLNEDLPLDSLQPLMLFANARILLHTLQERGPVKATEAGNLSRKFVDEIVERLVLPEGFLAAERAVSKVLNEKDIAPLHLPRVLLQMGHAVELDGGRFVLTELGEEMLADAQAGRLYALLFRTLFRNTNIEYFDRYPEAPGIQDGMPFSLLMIKDLADDWQREEELATKVILPYVRQQLPPNYAGQDSTPAYARARIFYHLERFGLLERRSVPDPTAVLGRVDDLRKTPQYDRFIDFDLPDE